MKFLLFVLSLFVLSHSNARASQSLELDDLMTPGEIAGELGIQPMMMDGGPTFLSGAHREKTREELVIIVNKAERGATAQKMTVYLHGTQLYQWDVSTGREQLETSTSGRTYWTKTPIGYFRPTRLYRKYYSNTWKTNLNNAMFFYGGVAMHATDPDHYDRLGRRASGGCVRLTQENAKTLYDLILQVGKGPVETTLRNGTVRTRRGQPVLRNNYKTLIIVENTED